MAVHRVHVDEPSNILRPSALRRSTPFRDGGGDSRREQQLDGCRRPRAALRRVGTSAQELDSCSVRRRSGFPRDSVAAGALQMLSDAFWIVRRPDAITTRCGCRAATDHRINIAHLVLHLIWNGKLSPGKKRAKKERTPGPSLFDSRCGQSWVFVPLFYLHSKKSPCSHDSFCVRAWCGS